MSIIDGHMSIYVKVARSGSAGRTACSKKIQRTLIMQCYTLTAITAAEKLTFMLIVDG